MDPTIAALLGALIGAVGGLAGGGLAALASLRASQIAARAPLAPKIHRLNEAIVDEIANWATKEILTASGRQAEIEKLDDGLDELHIAWNDFVVHQKILSPSDRISEIADFVLDQFTDSNMPPDVAATASTALVAATEMIAAHSPPPVSMAGQARRNQGDGEGA